TSRPPAATVLSCASATRSPRRSSSRSSARPDPTPITSPSPRRHPSSGAASALLLRAPATPGSVRRSGEHAGGADRGAFAQLRRTALTGTEHMGHRQLLGQQMVGDEPTMAAPPHGFGAHERTAGGSAPVDDGGEVGPELLGQAVVGIVVEAAVLPPGVGV